MNKGIEITLEINKLLQEYYKKTVAIKELLQKSEEDGFNGYLNKLLNSRDDLIEKHRKMKQEWNEILSSVDESSVEFISLVDERNQMVKKISSLEEEISQRLLQLKNAQADQIKQMNQSKKAHHAYSGYSPSIDGIFFDKKK